MTTTRKTICPSVAQEEEASVFHSEVTFRVDVCMCKKQRERETSPPCSHTGSEAVKSGLWSGSACGQQFISVPCYYLAVSYLRPHTRYSAKPLTQRIFFMHTWSKHVTSVFEIMPGLCLSISVIRLTTSISLFSLLVHKTTLHNSTNMLKMQ